MKLFRSIANIVFVLACLAGLGFGLGVLADPAGTTVLFNHAMAAFGVAFVAGLFETGAKTRLQKFFFPVGGALALATLHFAWSWPAWIGVGICAFLVLTMKLDGGD